MRQALFAPGQVAMLERLSTTLEELYHCKLYYQSWQRRGYIHPHIQDPYLRNLFVICAMLHDEYAVARLKNTFLGEHPILTDAQGEAIPYFLEYGGILTKHMEEGSHLLRYRNIFDSDPSIRKNTALPIVYRSIFEPLARHAGFLTPISPDYPLRVPNNTPEGNTFYRKAVAPFWQAIKTSLESSYASQFIETEQAIQSISENIDTFLERFLFYERN